MKLEALIETDLLNKLDDLMDRCINETDPFRKMVLTVELVQVQKLIGRITNYGKHNTRKLMESWPLLHLNQSL